MQTTLGAIALLTLLEASLSANITWDENTTVEQAARQYRIETYERYRLERDAYDRRTKPGNELFNRWIKAGQPKNFADAVVGWYRDAIRMGQENPYQQLPPIPTPVAERPSMNAKAKARSTNAFAEPQDSAQDENNAVEAVADDKAGKKSTNPLDQIKRVFLRATGLKK